MRWLSGLHSKSTPSLPAVVCLFEQAPFCSGPVFQPVASLSESPASAPEVWL